MNLRFHGLMDDPSPGRVGASGPMEGLDSVGKGGTVGDGVRVDELVAVEVGTWVKV